MNLLASTATLFIRLEVLLKIRDFKLTIEQILNGS